MTGSPDPTRSRRPLVRRLSAVVAALVALLVVIACSGERAGGTADPTVQNQLLSVRGTHGLPVGIAFGDSLFGDSRPTLNTILRTARSLGVTWIRIDMSWADLQPTSARDFAWASMDRIVAAAGRNHLHVLGILDYTPPWARAGGCTVFACPPADNRQFASFAAAVVGRYAAAGVTHFEIWNEPNLNMFWTDPNPVAYRNLLITTAAAMRAANRHVFVLFGGMTPIHHGSDVIPAATFVREACAGDVCPVNAVAFHPYTSPGLPQTISQSPNNWQLMASTTDTLGLRAAMRAVGLGSRPIWVTEFGAPTNYPGSHRTVTRQRQADMVIDGLRLAVLERAWVGGYFIDTWRDDSTRGELADHFGLIGVAGHPKPAFYALRRYLVG